MMSGNSPFPLVNIGRGGLEGLRTFSAANQRASQLEEREAEQADTGAYRKANLDPSVKKFSDSAAAATKHLQNEQDRIAAQTAHEHNTEGLTAEQRDISRGHLDLERQRASREAGQGFWEPQAPIMKDGQPVMDPATGSPMWQWIDRKNNKTQQGPYQPVPANETGDPNARITADINAQFGHLRQNRRQWMRTRHKAISARLMMTSGSRRKKGYAALMARVGRPQRRALLIRSDLGLTEGLSPVEQALAIRKAPFAVQTPEAAQRFFARQEQKPKSPEERWKAKLRREQREARP
ncbi:MAG TPA: hypothetical protein VGU20_20310 [Stellaceae bacterium]|nr:hypothetical protein [Stellaceae bacterium]